MVPITSLLLTGSATSTAAALAAAAASLPAPPALLSAVAGLQALRPRLLALGPHWSGALESWTVRHGPEGLQVASRSRLGNANALHGSLQAPSQPSRPGSGFLPQCPTPPANSSAGEPCDPCGNEQWWGEHRWCGGRVPAGARCVLTSRPIACSLCHKLRPQERPSKRPASLLPQPQQMTTPNGMGPCCGARPEPCTFCTSSAPQATGSTWPAAPSTHRIVLTSWPTTACSLTSTSPSLGW